jgi:hypothetical protein
MGIQEKFKKLYHGRQVHIIVTPDDGLYNVVVRGGGDYILLGEEEIKAENASQAAKLVWDRVRVQLEKRTK